MLARGFDLGRGSYPPEASSSEVRAEAANWRLLLQIDSDADLAFWGDGGMIYWWIRADDLMDLRFDRVWFFWQ